MIRLIKLDQVKEWNDALKKVGKFDFYNTNFYNKLAKRNNEGEPELLTFAKNSSFIVLPLLKRQIGDTNLYDYTSVYGYPTVLTNNDLDDDFLVSFKKELLSFFKSHNIVSVFVRLHPLIKTDYVFDNFGEVENKGCTVFIDLAIPVEEQRRQYRKSLKSEVNQLRNKHCVTVSNTTHHSEIEEFVELYHENMKRVNAKSYYYFDKEYFINFITQNEFDVKLKIAKQNNKIIAGSLFTYVNDIIEYHLAATHIDFLKLTPMKLIIDETRIEGTKMGFKFLHLGGGLGGGKDSLFKFKSGFSNNISEFKVWKLIVDESIYNQLSQNINVEEESSFFPLYRIN